MDTLTHILTGMAAGQLFSNEREQHRANHILWGAIAANIPDADTVFQLFLPVETASLFHRGLSHSLLLWALCSPLLALLINRIYKGNRRTYFKWLKISVLAWFLHIFLDIFNTYGTGIFEPFSHTRFSYDAVNVIDLWMTIPVAIMVIRFVYFIRLHYQRRAAALAAIIYPVLYIYIAIFFKIHVEYSGNRQLVEQYIFPTRVISSPLPLSPFAWKVVAETEEGYHTGVFYGFWKSETQFTFHKKDKLLEISYLFDPKYQKMKQFMKGWFLLEKIDGQVYMHDLRFSTLDPEKHGLSFKLHINENHDVIIDRAYINRYITFKNAKNVYKRLFQCEEREWQHKYNDYERFIQKKES
jgi:inner membrane protein